MTALHRLVAVAALCGGGWWSGTAEVNYLGRKRVQSCASGLVKASGVVALVAATVVSAGCSGRSTPLTYNVIFTSLPTPSPIPLTPNAQGYVRIETTGGSTGCSINTELVACESFKGNWHNASGQRYRVASVSASGEFHWVEADLGALQGRVTLGDQTYSAQGWTIRRTSRTSAETEFTNEQTHHGMTVSDQTVAPF